MECGDILGITTKLAQEKRKAKDILEYVLHQVVEFKKLNQVRLAHSLKNFVSQTMKFAHSACFESVSMSTNLVVVSSGILRCKYAVEAFLL